MDKDISAPEYCTYASGQCDQSFNDIVQSEAFFIYPSKPTHLASTITECISHLREKVPSKTWLSWGDLSTGGQIIFCEICKAIKGTKQVVANITNLNFNVLFELGFAIGHQIPVLPIRDITYEESKKTFDEIGIFDTLGYEQFTNSIELASILIAQSDIQPPVYKKPELDKFQPILFIRSPIDTDGSITLFSSLKKSWFRFRTFDSRETPRISLHDAFKHVLSSVSVIAHLIDPNRVGANIHNARSAFLCGIALASNKHVLMIQESSVSQPIDYRDIVVPYSDPNTIPYIVRSVLRYTADKIQSIDAYTAPLPSGLLESIDMGDVAAENEIRALSKYFVKTPQYQQARQGHARIVIGRKGTGKSALFYGVRNQFPSKGDDLVLDLKPEGHQFTRLREMVLKNLSEGLQLHTLTAFWHYLLLLEVTGKLIRREQYDAYQSPEALERFNELVALYEEQMGSEGDFSERLMTLVNRLVSNVSPDTLPDMQSEDLTNAIYTKDISKLNRSLIDHLVDYDSVWILIDNIDKGFPTHGLQPEDVLIIRCLLEATRKLQTSIETRKIDCKAIIFIRKDVYDHLVDNTPDRGKESYVNLDWSDEELIKELVLKRFQCHASELKGSFDEVWSRIFDPHVFGENSFGYIISRTFHRPRDILNFVRKCIQIAVSRNHDRVEEDDVLSAEIQFSSDMLDELRYEVRDTFPDLPDFTMAFLESNRYILSDDVDNHLLEIGVPKDTLEEVRNILLWFSFIGIQIGEEDKYAHEYAYDINKLKSLSDHSSSQQIIYTIHPAFHVALSISQ